MLKFKNIQELRTLDLEIAQMSHTAFSSGSQEKNLFVPTDVALKGVRATLHSLFEDVEELDVSHPLTNALASHFKDYLSSVQLGLDSLIEDPGKAYHMLGTKINGLCLGDHRPKCVRHEVLMANVKNMGLLWEEAILPKIESFDDLKLARLQGGLAEAHSAIRFTVPKLRTVFRGFKKQMLDEMKKALVDVLENIENHISFINGQYDDLFSMPAQTAIGDDESISVVQQEYRQRLQNNVGVDLDEILKWYEDENEKTRAEVISIASKLDKKAKTTEDAIKLLFKFAGPCDSQEEMFARTNEYLIRARAAACEHIWLPKEEVCELVPIPEHLRSSFPWGGYMGDYPSRYPLYNRMFLNNHNYSSITDGWLKVIALHEGYPGHHSQFIRSAIDPIPETMKRGANAVAFSEGACIRSERVFEHVFAEDPYYPLMVAVRRHHTSTRLKVDLMLFYFNKTIKEACEVYEKELGYDGSTARAQVQAHEFMQGYFTGYYYGLKKICDLEKELKWDPKAFTELLFSVGRVNLDTFEKIAKLQPQDRHSLLHNYASKLQFA